MRESLDGQLGDNSLDEITLKSGNFRVFTLIPFSPDMGGTGDIDELSVDADPVPGNFQMIGQFIFHLIITGSGNLDIAGFGQTIQAGRHKEV